MLRSIDNYTIKTLKKFPNVEVRFHNDEIFEIYSPIMEDKNLLANSIYKELHYLIEYQTNEWSKEKGSNYLISVVSWEKKHVIEILESKPESKIAEIFESIAKKIGII